ncbi:dihydrofolate reductase family protein [Saccharothrix sp. ALI-22-I]|uniref:dihydrofolate reductase family protein n=1 Tax=Saccharothrix sp. ALI-22-I TaxID=1933778 RepID=UPI000A006742|nr:dihydrofolate reductase family protein [Saccharothrix sp. ALI-22-I]
MGKVILHSAVTVNAAYEAPTPEHWLELDNDSKDANLGQLTLADAMLLGRKTYEGLAAVWPTLGQVPGMEKFAARINAMPKYVASRTLSGPLEWNATLLEGDLAESVKKVKENSTLWVSGSGEFAQALAERGLIDEYWFGVHPHLWPSGPRFFDGFGPLRLDLVSTTQYKSGVVMLRYRPANAEGTA